MESVLPMYNAHPYFSLKSLGKKMHIIHNKYSTFREGEGREKEGEKP